VYIKTKRRLKMEKGEMEKAIEKGRCSWCTKTGIKSFIPLRTDTLQNVELNKSIEELNARMMTNKLIKIAEGLFACKECVSAYGLKPAE
jgi:hypothetical protein